MIELVAHAYYSNDGGDQVHAAVQCAFQRTAQGIYLLTVNDGCGVDVVGCKPTVTGIGAGETHVPLVFSFEWISQTEFEVRSVTRNGGLPVDPLQMWITVERIPRIGVASPA